MRTVVGVLAVVLLASGLSVGCAPPTVTGSGTLATVTRDVSGFDRVEVRDGIPVEIGRSGSYQIAITSDDNALQHIDVSRKNSTLVVSLTANLVVTVMDVKVLMPELRGLKLTGGARAAVEGFALAQDLDVEMSGASVLEMDDMSAAGVTFAISDASLVSGEIEADAVGFEVRDASLVKLEGSATDTAVDASGASFIHLGDFRVDNADVELRVASRAILNAEKKLDGVLADASTLGYIGDPTGNISRSHSSRVYRIE